MPKRKPGESKDDFVSRCMGSSQMNSEFPDQAQRAAVCYQYSGEKHKAIKDAAEHLEAASQFDHGEMSEKDYKMLQAAHQHHAKCLKEYLRDTDGNQVHHDTSTASN